MIFSAANQFARDGGKVLSNSVYGDAHSTPIRRVGTTTNEHGGIVNIYDGDKEEVTAEEVRQSYIESGYSFKISRTSIGQVVGVAALGVIPCFISSLAFVAASLRRIYRFFADDAHYAKKALVARKVPDKRYSRGYRVEGYTKGYEIVQIPPTMRERSYHLLIAIIYASIAAGIGYWNFWALKTLNDESSISPTEQVSTD